ncbi:MAG: biotin--[acetyl-CoA-carboxylase] ligase [Sedimentisphaerales bacterium]|nr:biotin--[acetyl-CoA-carboxylase] ligase [Sedimentisphaerales bacterium]
MATEILNSDSIASNLKTTRIGREILVYASTASTNDAAWHYASNKKNDGLAIFAEEQSAGRGRGGNTWLSQKGRSVLCSILLLNETCQPEMLTLAAAVAVAEAIGRCGSGQARIKWPNDILIGGKKVAGILLESKRSKGHFNYVIGIGINCHQKTESFPTELRSLATSIDIESKTTGDRISLAKRLLVSLDDWLDEIKKESNAVLDRWYQLSVQCGHRVTLQYNRRTFTGRVLGIDPREGLIVQLENGGVRMFSAAHTAMVRSDDE